MHVNKACPFATVRTPAGCVRKSATWTCCRPPNTQPRSCTSSGTGRGPAETHAVVLGATRSGSHRTDQVALWVKYIQTLVVSFCGFLKKKKTTTSKWVVSDFYQLLWYDENTWNCWKIILKTLRIHCRFLILTKILCQHKHLQLQNMLNSHM